MISSIRIELNDRDGSQWQPDEIIRAIEKTVSLMGRLLPKKGIVTATITSGMIVDDTYLDITTILPTTARLGDSIQRVEYPTGRTPPEFIPVEIMGNYLWLKTNVPIKAGEDIRLLYQGVWAAPTESAPGDYPPHLDNIVIIGATGQALIFKAEYYTHLSAKAVEKAMDILDELITITFPDAPDLTSGDIAYFMGKAKDTLVKAQSAFGTALATLSSMDSPLGEGASRISCLPLAATNARTYLGTGEPLINKVTVGDKVGEIYNQYAVTEVALGKEHVQSGVAYVNVAGGWEAKSGRESIIANGYIQEAAQHLAAVRQILGVFESEVTLNRNKVDMYRAQLESMSKENNIPSQYLAVAGRYLASGQAKINEFLASLGFKPELQKTQTSAKTRD